MQTVREPFCELLFPVTGGRVVPRREPTSSFVPAYELVRKNYIEADIG